MGAGTYHELCKYPGTSGIPVTRYQISQNMGEALYATGSSRTGSGQMGGWAGGTDLARRLTRSSQMSADVNKSHREPNGIVIQSHNSRR